MIYCFTGYPLSGKSTWAKRFATSHDYNYFSTGEYARIQGMKKTEESIMKHDISLELNDKINTEVLRRIDNNLDFVVDGWPRSEEQVLLLESTGCVYKTIFMTMDPMIIMIRMEQRNRSGDEINYVQGRIMAMIKFHEKMVDMGHNLLYVDGRELEAGGISWLEQQLVK